VSEDTRELGPPHVRILFEVSNERLRQLDKGFDAEHDDRHSLPAWAYLLLRRVTDLSHPWAEAHPVARQELIEIAAIAIAAVESLDRAAARPPG
jgi:hypothetical protein